MLGAWPVLDRRRARLLAAGSGSRSPTSFAANASASSGRLCNKHHRAAGPALLPVHVLGHPADMAALVELRGNSSWRLSKTPARAWRAQCRRAHVGSLGDIACFSYNGNKLITTGGGGMIVTDNEAWADKAKYLTTQAKDDPVEYVHGEIGYNYRLTNVLAAIGLAQMEQLDAYLATKRRIADFYAAAGRPVGNRTDGRGRLGDEQLLAVYVLVDAERISAWGAGPCCGSWPRRGSSPGRSGSRFTPVRPMRFWRPAPARWPTGCIATPSAGLFGRNHGRPVGTRGAGDMP